MQGVISFHPIDPGFFETLVEPLVAGEKVNPETFVDAACRLRRACWISRAYKLALERLLEELESPPPLEEGTLWERVRSRLERFDYRVPALAHLASTRVEPELHLHGRPFLIAEGSAERVAEVAATYARGGSDETLGALARAQLSRLDPELARRVEPEILPEPTRDATYGAKLLQELKRIHEDAREEESRRELPWRSVYLHSRAVPFWIARNGETLGSLCRAAGVEPPSCLGPALPVLRAVCDPIPVRGDEKTDDSRKLGGYVGPDDVGELLAFLTGHGSRIIRSASRHGEAARCSELLRKIRECVQFAEQHGVGYLEASDIHPVLESPSEIPEAATALV